MTDYAAQAANNATKVATFAAKMAAKLQRWLLCYKDD
jgi:hypothetical protein